MEQQGKYISALDIGTSKVIALIGEVQDDKRNPHRRTRTGTVLAALKQAW